MEGVALSLVVLVGVALASLQLTALLRPRSTTTRLLLAYVVGWAILVIVPLGLSPFEALDRPGIVLGVGLCVTLATAGWLVGGRPTILPAARPSLARARRHLRDPVIAVPTAAVTLVYGYLVAVGLALPQNDGDPLVYHLTRAALWRQQHAVGIVGDGVELRLDGNPIVAELAQAVWLTLAESERLVWIGQLVAAWALALGVVAVARRIGIPAREAALSAVVTLALPVVALQAVTAYNDVILASFVVVAVAFALGRERSDLCGLALAVALVVGTKFTGPLFLPLVVVSVLVGGGSGHRLRGLAAVAFGTLAGSGWYVVNLARTGDPTGGIQEAGEQSPVLTVAGLALRAQQLFLDAFDVSGLEGDWRFAYALAGAILLVLAVARARPPTTAVGGDLLLAGSILIALPVLVALARFGSQELLIRAWTAAGDMGAVQALQTWGLSRVADGSDSWFGPLFVPLVAASVVVAAVAALRRAVPPIVPVLASAPLVATGVLATAITYDPWRGRLLIAAAALSVASWGVITRVRWVAVLVASVATVSVLASAATWLGKPSGLGHDAGRGVGSAWGLERWEVQTLLRRFDRTERDEQAAIRFVADHVPDDATVAQRLRWNDFRFPAFGGDLGRTVLPVGRAELPPEAGWAVVAPGLAGPRCPQLWIVRYDGPTGWRVLERLSDGAPCDGGRLTAGSQRATPDR